MRHAEVQAEHYQGGLKLKTVRCIAVLSQKIYNRSDLRIVLFSPQLAEVIKGSEGVTLQEVKDPRGTTGIHATRKRGSRCIQPPLGGLTKQMLVLLSEVINSHRVRSELRDTDDRICMNANNVMIVSPYSWISNRQRYRDRTRTYSHMCEIGPHSPNRPLSEALVDAERWTRDLRPGATRRGTL
jgi:hypothetical protein